MTVTKRIATIGMTAAAAAMEDGDETTENRRNHLQFKSLRPSLKDNETTQKTA